MDESPNEFWARAFRHGLDRWIVWAVAVTLIVWAIAAAVLVWMFE